MKIIIFGFVLDTSFIVYFDRMLSILECEKADIYIYKSLHKHLNDKHKKSIDSKYPVISKAAEIDGKVDFIFSIGGDGTFLKASLFLENYNIPVVGINSGRLGFLSSISKLDLEEGITKIINGNFDLEERSMLEIISENKVFDGANYAINEVTVAKTDSSSMINVHVNIDGEYLNTFWADGLIISTPTGSTGYSLSVGGPIISPDCQCFVISPIAPHSLTVRPIIIPDSSEIEIRVEGRTNKYLIALDSRSDQVDLHYSFKLKKSYQKVKTARLGNRSFYSNLREKLNWGKMKSESSKF
ncbi:MAG: NAD kinase [Bacteroidales bacterium]